MALNPKQIAQLYLSATVNDRVAFEQIAQLLRPGDLKTMIETNERMREWLSVHMDLLQSD